MPFNPDFDPARSVTKVLELAGGLNELTVIVPPWHANPGILTRRAKYENSLGRSVLALQIDDDVLSSDVERTLRSIEVISEALAQQT